MKWPRWSRRAEQWSEELREEAREHVGDFTHWRLVLIVLSVMILLLSALGIYWSREPAPFDVASSVSKALREPIEKPAAGAVTTATLIQVVSTLLDKSGGFINNDIAPPGVWLDNISSWERGALRQTRDLTKTLLDDVSRTDSTAGVDEDLAHVEPRLGFSDNSWMLPSSESKYSDARNYLRNYLSRLQGKEEPAAQFAATTVNLDHYLARVTLRLDTAVQQLSACVSPRENPLIPSRVGINARLTLTPANRIDDVFYEARGSAWALLHLLRAIDIDFAAVLREKNAQDSLREAIRALDATQDKIYSPVILNGGGFGLVANHSLVMASYMARADTAVANVRRLLTEAAPTPNAETTPAQPIAIDHVDAEN